MNNMARVEVLESLGKLVYDEFNMNILEYPFGDDIVEVGFHKLEN